MNYDIDIQIYYRDCIELHCIGLDCIGLDCIDIGMVDVEPNTCTTA
jgi:hypothetical protein